jgi:eukaryotic-like serine/threonine-protein kinase
MLQVCRALAHAHAAGILHRDVKPENIMIRADGVVKLMDFGISHMVDLERLTVTGQLLGSPAYMAPEHVEGRPIDYRTDVFAAGIVLYQLTTGRLPFEGKNPHEVLKRIAECKFTDPRQVNTRIGNRLGKIILRAMAAEPNDRYSGIGEMVTALEGYLEESGIAADKVQGELSRYFASPPAYELALEERLVDHLTRRGQEMLSSGDRAQALDIFDRVLTIDADNERVIAILDGINRRTRLKAYAMIAGFAAVMGLGAYMVHRRSQVPDNDVPSELGNGSVALSDRKTVVVKEPAPPLPADAALVAVAEDARGGSAVIPPIVDANPSPQVGKRTTFTVFPPNEARYRLDGGEWRRVVGGSVSVDLAADTLVEVENLTGCCGPASHVFKPGETFEMTTPFMPALLEFECDVPGVKVYVDDKSVRFDVRHTITFPDNSIKSTQKVMVKFIGDKVSPDAQSIEVAANRTSTAKCEPR